MNAAPTCAPATVEQLAAELVRASAQGQKNLTFDLRAINRILEHIPEDMTVTVEAGLTLDALQARLAQRGQWLPIDPPNPAATTIADLLNFNLSGPRRFGYGAIREHLLGLKVLLADGRTIHSGGKVVKNVAGYDLCRLFVGSQGSLGVIVEASFKVRPLPEAEKFVAAPCASLSQAGVLLETIQQSELTPVLLDLANLGSLGPPDVPLANCRLLLGLAGSREEVEWQLNQAARIGLAAPASLEYETTFWNAPEKGAVHRLSVLPSRLIGVLPNLQPSEFVARAGNGIIYYRGGQPPPKVEVPVELSRRIKQTYDPSGTLPNLPELDTAHHPVPGLRPSAGAAMDDQRTASEKTAHFHHSEPAAPEDGRSPGATSRFQTCGRKVVL